MKILVCISITPDTTTKITFINDNKEFNSTGVQFIINPYDEIALSRAIELRDAMGGTVTVINVGEADAEPNIRKALAIGADDAIRINAKPLDSYFVASQIAIAVKDLKHDIIITGMETINYNGAQVAGMLGELLGIPSVSGITKLDLSGNIAVIKREIDGGQELLTTSIPCVVSTQEGTAEPRIPNMRGIMSARTKTLKVVEPQTIESFTSTIKYDLPSQKASCKFVDAENAEKLIDLLHNEAKII